MTDIDKLNMIQKYFIEYIQGWETLADFVQFLNNVTKAKIITALENRLQADADGSGEVITNEQTRIEMLMGFKDEINNL